MRNSKVIGALIVGILIGFLSCYVWNDGKKNFRTKEKNVSVSEVNTTPPSESRNDASAVLVPEARAVITAEMQLAGDVVVVKEVTMPQSGWVVVHEVIDGSVANALGASRVDEGQYDLVTVELLRPTIPENTYVVTLYSDDGDKQFEIGMDTPIVGEDGKAIFREFQTASGSAN